MLTVLLLFCLRAEAEESDRSVVGGKRSRRVRAGSKKRGWDEPERKSMRKTVTVGSVVGRVVAGIHRRGVSKPMSVFLSCRISSVYLGCCPGIV